MKEILVAVLLVLIAILLLNPFHFWMPNMVTVAILLCFLVLAAIFASFVLRETKTDERDLIHRSLAGRNAYLFGSAILILAILIQGYQHSVDPWLVMTLLVMVVAKVGTRIWSDRNR